MPSDEKKRNERSQVELFLESRGLKARSRPPDSERPDWLVELSDGKRLAIELTEYRPNILCHGKSTRSAIEGRWKGLWALIDETRRKHHELERFSALLSFRNRELPGKSQHQEFAEAVVRLVRQEAHAVPLGSKKLEISFHARADLRSLQTGYPTARFVAREDWPILAEQLRILRIRRYSDVAWPYWACRGVYGAWVAPSALEFQRILKGKAAKSVGYDLRGAQFWLVIVCDVAGDATSHIFPEDQSDLEELRQAIEQSGFNFGVSPFHAVWLLSNFSAASIALYNRSTPPTARSTSSSTNSTA